MIKTVFLDMDGVLCNFRKGIHDAFNKPYNYSTLSKKWKFWDDWSDVTFEMVNAICTTTFWQNLEWMHDSRDILRTIMDTVGLEKVYFLTTPMPNLESASGKMMWVNDNLPIYLKRTIITQAPKYLLAQPDTLLLDDKNENVDGFIEVGGHSILINRPWNKKCKRANNTVEDLRNSLENLE